MRTCIGWPANVNRKILDSSSVTIGEGASVSDSLETGGKKRTRALCSVVPDKISVTMDFEYTRVGNEAESELERFLRWYKFVHKYGEVPFEFPRLLISSGSKPMEKYSIRDGLQFQKSGLCMRVMMTWESVPSETITFTESDPTVSGHKFISAYSSKKLYGVQLIFTSSPTTVFTTDDFELKAKKTGVTEEIPLSPSIEEDDNNYYIWFTLETGTYEYVSIAFNKATPFHVKTSLNGTDITVT